MQRCLEEGVDTDKDGQIDRDEFRGEMLWEKCCDVFVTHLKSQDAFCNAFTGFHCCILDRPLVKSRFPGLVRLVPAHFSRHDRESASAESAQRGRVSTKRVGQCRCCCTNPVLLLVILHWNYGPRILRNVSFDPPALVVDIGIRRLDFAHSSIEEILACTAQH